MNWLDIVVLFLVVMAVFQGLRTGFVRTLSAAVGAFLGVALAGQLAGQVAPALEPVLGAGNISRIAASVIIFLAVFIAASFVGNIVRQALHLTLLGWLDTLLGGFMGLVMGFVTTGFLLIALGKFPLPGVEGVIRESRLAPVVIRYVPVALGLLPPEFESVLKLLQ